MAPSKSRGNSTASSDSSGHGSTVNSLKMRKTKKEDVNGIENGNYIDDEGNSGYSHDLHGEKVELAELPNSTDVDPYKIITDLQNDGPLWKDLTGSQRVKTVALNITKIICLIGLLYFFVCALDILGSAFRLIAGITAGQVFKNNTLLTNPVAGLMIGVLVTVLLQSSSTSTSIIVAMVGSGILEVSNAVYIIMGANIGTSVTSTIVAMTQAGDKEIFRRAFAGGTVHDMFNWLTVLVLLPLEWGTNYLMITTDAITKSLENSTDTNGTHEMQFLQAITRPLTDLIVQVDEAGIEKAASSNATDISLLLRVCGQHNETNATGYTHIELEPCHHAFTYTSLADTEIGLILLFGALVVICGSLIILVKVLSGMLKGSVAQAIKKTINFDFKFPFTFVTGYIALLVGAGMTVIVQSSSVFTSILTPLVGVGVISIERMYPLALGSNLGTTATSVLAALASPAATFHDSLQTALVHLFFNLSGVVLWYPVPFMRQVPIGAAKFLGDTTAEYRWFALMYILFVFFLIPGMVFLLSWLGWQYLAGIGGPILFLFLLVIIINILQNKLPKVLPAGIRNWRWLPEPLRSLAPYDKVIRKVFGVIPGCRSLTSDLDSSLQEPVTILKNPLEINMCTFSMKSDSLKEKNDPACVLSSIKEI